MQVDASSDSISSLMTFSTEMLFIAGLDGEILRWSDRLGRWAGRALTQGTPLQELVHADDRPGLSAIWAQLHQSSDPIEVPCRVLGAERTYGRFACMLRASRDDRAVYGAFRDLPAETVLPADVVKVGERERILNALTDNLPIVVWAIDRKGIFIYHDGKGTDAIGLPRNYNIGKNIFELYGDNEESVAGVNAVLRGEQTHTVTEAHDLTWESWMVPIRDSAGRVESAIGFSLDVTEATRAQRELQAKLDLIQRQKKVIQGLSIPIIQVWDGVLALPMIGVLDTVRASEVMEGLLDKIVVTEARFAILDLTGVEVVDTSVANHLINLVSAIRLLGAEGIICGIRSNVAQTIVALGLDLTRIVTRANLRSGLTFCIQQLGGPKGTGRSPADGAHRSGLKA